MNAYHFLTADFALQSIVKRRLKISLLSDLNDPFELLSNELSTAEHRHLFSQFKAQLAAKYGVVCFSRHWSNPVLWSHYADRHKGMCLGFEIPDDLIRAVTYSGRRLQLKIERKLTKGRLDRAALEQIMTTKYEDWSYEDEIRIFLDLETPDSKTGLYFKDYGDDLQLREVILGARCIFRGDEIESTLGELIADVDVIRARLAFKSFRVVTNKVATRKHR